VAESTASERYLAKLCRRSFLRLWSWPNVYRDQKCGKATIGKEVCDLLVVFDDHIFIFSDKYCQFPNTGDINLDWIRWFKKAILKSAMQVSGAERWLRQFPQRLFLDKFCKEAFPVTLPPEEKTVFHRVVVAHGSGQRCRQVFGGGSGSLVINPRLIGKDHYDPSSASFAPFMIGKLTEAKGFVHVIDDFSLDILLTTLDTAPDLARYLQLRAEFIDSGKLGIAAGEEDLLAHYLRHANDEGRHHFYVPSDVTSIVIGADTWSHFSVHPQYQAKLEADQVSYAWDHLIETFTKHLLEGSQYQIPEYRLVDPSIATQEKGLRFLARESRFRRRMLSKALLGLIRNGNEHGKAARIVTPMYLGEPYYVFLSLQHPADRSYEVYRRGRARLLEAYCLATRLEYHNAQYVIGIATEPLDSYGRSEDMCVLDGNSWSEELAKEADALKKEFGIFTGLKQTPFHELEYPLERNQQTSKGRHRNQTCACGSGRKYKKCCGVN
jgi:hypothetical protein